MQQTALNEAVVSPAGLMEDWGKRKGEDEREGRGQ